MRVLLPEPQSDVDNSTLASVYEWPAAPEGRPWVRTNFAHTVDCSFTDADGLSAGVSGEADKDVFTLLRATCDAVLVGAGTARAENYGPITIRENLKAIRKASGRDSDPRLVLMTVSGNISAELKEVATIIEVGSGPDELLTALRKLRDEGIERLLCEGGPHLFTDLVAADLVDDMCMTTTPRMLGTSKLTLLTHKLEQPQNVELSSLVEDDGTLMARWTVSR